MELEHHDTPVLSKEEKEKGKELAVLNVKEQLKNEKDKNKETNQAIIDVEISKLLEEKRSIIGILKSLTKKFKYLNIEKEALEKLLKDYNEKELQRLQIRLKSLEFKMQTKAITAKKEKELLKEIVDIERKIATFRPMIKAKKRLKFINTEIENLQHKIKEQEERLKQNKEKLDALFKQKREMDKKSKGSAKGIEKTISLTDIAVIEKKEKKKK